MNKDKTTIIKETDERFVNPYNFIPLRKKCKREVPVISEEDSYTGYFECSMRLLTPLFIPNTSSSVRLIEQKEWEEGEREKKKYIGYDFFSYEDLSEAPPYIDQSPAPPCNPVIPGSEIRGAVRSVYEAAFNGCMSTVDMDRALSRKCGEVKKPGVLKWNSRSNKWYLHPCEKARLLVEQRDGTTDFSKKGKLVRRKKYDQWKEGQEIWVKTDKMKIVDKYEVVTDANKRKFEGSNIYSKGYLHKGEHIDRKNYEAVFYKIAPKGNIVFDEDIELLKRVLKEYNDDKKNCKLQENGWYSQLNISKEHAPILVYYAEDSARRKYICPACIGREAFKKTIGNLLKNNGGYQPCSDIKLCPSCQIFGMMEKAEESGTNAYGSKIRITDALLRDQVENSRTLFEEPVVLPELGEPQPSAVEFYTDSPYGPKENKGGSKKQGYWTYDYKYTYKDKWGNKNKNREALNNNLPKIRGRKYYWHKEVEMSEFKDNKVSPMRQRIRPMKPNGESDPQPMFQFRVYYEQLGKKQLEQLKFAFDFGSPECAHKIGRGKPLGFGSVQIIVDKLHIRDIDEKTGCWKIKTIGEKEKINFEDFFKDSGSLLSEIPESLKIMANWEKRPSNVDYPRGEDKTNKGENEEAAHQWFTLNKGTNNFNPVFDKLLPVAEEDVNKNLENGKALYKLVKKKV